LLYKSKNQCKNLLILQPNRVRILSDPARCLSSMNSQGAMLIPFKSQTQLEATSFDKK
jgi:hypothetical protein